MPPRDATVAGCRGLNRRLQCHTLNTCGDRAPAVHARVAKRPLRRHCGRLPGANRRLQ